MTRAAQTTIVVMFRRFAVPLACYYGVTLVLPLANGAAAQPGVAFVGHALVVLVVPPMLILIACGIYKLVHVVARSATR
jgi:hypothetical protein